MPDVRRTTRAQQTVATKVPLDAEPHLEVEMQEPKAFEIPQDREDGHVLSAKIVDLEAYLFASRRAGQIRTQTAQTEMG